MANLEKEKLSRREFLITGAFAGAGFLAIKWDVEKVAQNFSPTFNLEKLKDFTVLPPEFPTPSKLVGINLNAPFLWQEVDSPEKIERAIENANQFGARTIRVFVNDEFEPELEDYHFEVLEKIEKLAQKFPLQVDLFDAYPLLHASDFNPVYGSSSLSSPYLVIKEKTLIQQQLDFFTDKSIEKIFLRRVKEIIGSLNHVPGIAAWSVANELAPPTQTGKRAKEILTSWYEKVVTEIRKIDKERPILSGVADPTLLDEERLKACGLSANTIHLYPDLTENAFRLYQTNHKRVLPLICQEIGFPSKIFDFSFSSIHDELFSRFLSHNFSSFFEINEKEKWLKPKITSISLWHLSFPGDSHRDGFELTPENLPKTLKVLQNWKKIL